MRFRPSRKLIILLGAGVLLFVLYVLAGFLLVPRLVRGQLADFAREQYRREISIGAVRFNPFTLTLELDQLSFPDADRTPMLGFERLSVNLGIASLWRRGASFQSIDIEQPFCRAVIRPGGALNLADLANPLSATPAAPRADEKPPRFFVDQFAVVRGAFDFEDRAHATAFRTRLQPLSFTLREFSTTGETGNAYALRAEAVDGGHVSWSGTFALAPFSSRGNFELAEVSAEKLWSYLRDALAFRVAGGTLTVQGGYEFTTGAGSKMLIDLAKVNLADLGVGPRNGTEIYAQIDRFEIAGTKLDVTNARVDVGPVRLAGAAVTLRREADGHINLLELVTSPPVPGEASAANVAGEATPAAAPAAPSAARTWSFNAPQISVAALRVALEDRFVRPAATFALDPIAVEVRNFSTDTSKPFEIEAQVRIDGKGTLNARVTAAHDGGFRGAVELADLDLVAFQPYIGTYTQMTLRRGALDAKLEVEAPASGALRIAGQTRVANLHTVDNALQQDFIKWDALEMAGMEYRSQPESLAIASIATRAPYLRLIIAPDQSTNIGRILTVPASAPGAVQTVRVDGENVAAAPQRPLAMRIGKVTITNGAANFSDFWIQPNYAVNMQELAGSIRGLSSDPRSRARLSLAGKLDRYAPATIEGEVNLLSASLFTDLAVHFKGVELTSVTPYSGRFAGYRIEKGKLSVDLKYHVENRKLDAEQRFIVDQLQLGDRVDSPDAVHLPLKIAVALLKDRNGVIDLGLPVSGSLDDPQFRLGPIIWKAFVNLLGDIARSPFTLLGKMFGGGPELNLVDFEAGSPALTDGAREKMAALRKAMLERPQLALDVPAISAPDVDGPALAALALQGKLPTAGEPAQRFEVLLALYQAEFGQEALPTVVQPVVAMRARTRTPADLEAANAELTRALLAKHAPANDALDELARGRARAVQEALLGSGDIEATRVFVLAAQSRPAIDGKVRLELSLK